MKFEGREKSYEEKESDSDLIQRLRDFVGASLRILS